MARLQQRSILLALVIGLVACMAVSPRLAHGVEMTPDQRVLLAALAKQPYPDVTSSLLYENQQGSPVRKLHGLSPFEKELNATKELLSMGITLSMDIKNLFTNLRSVGSSPNLPALDMRYSLNMEDTVIPKGYPLETHTVYTDDGYILTMHRIPRGRYRNTEKKPKPVVYLQHGITLASNSFTILNANESMAFILADAGFDVWMGNTRGNTFSRGHQWLKNTISSPYWYITMDDLALYDLPPMIDYALKMSGAKKLAFIGHSQGCTLAYMMLSALDSFNDKMSVVLHMGPVAYPKWFRAYFLKQQALVYNDQILKIIRLGEFLFNRFTAPLFLPMCRQYAFHPWCVQQMNRLFYGPSEYITTDDFWIIAATWPSSVASRNLEHWAQMFRSNHTARLQKYDYGTDCSRLGQPFYESCNQIKYGAMVPPEYDLGRIRAPQVWLLGDLDIVSVPEDVAMQQKKLKKKMQFGQYITPKYGHMDFVWDRNARHMPDVVDVMFRFSPGTY